MGHYALLNKENIVINIITGRDENDIVNGISNWEEYYGNKFNLTCKRTCYNTYGNQHNAGGVPFRKNAAGKDFIYDPINDAFIPPKPFNSWILNTTTFLWDAPIEYPADGNNYNWNEETQQWDLITK